MPIIRNPFRNKDQEPIPPILSSRDASFNRPESLASSRKSSSMDVKVPPEYKLSDINDSGVYLPPSPSETKTSFWSTRSKESSYSGTSNSNHRALLCENEPFNMSRESFDSYRRSFDISARSPVVGACEFPARGSLDSRRMPSMKLPSASPIKAVERRHPTPTREVDESGAEKDEFEDVGLDDPKPKKKSMFARFSGEVAARPDSPANDRPGTGNSGHHGFHFGLGGGRKRGDSGRGAELGNLKTIQRANGIAAETRNE